MQVVASGQVAIGRDRLFSVLGSYNLGWAVGQFSLSGHFGSRVGDILSLSHPPTPASLISHSD